MPIIYNTKILLKSVTKQRTKKNEPMMSDVPPGGNYKLNVIIRAFGEKMRNSNFQLNYESKKFIKRFL